MSDIYEVVSRYVDLQTIGGSFKTCCPFHGEDTPSFILYEDTESWYCFGCAEGGDSIEFVKKIEGIPFQEAKSRVTSILGGKVPVTNTKEKKSSKKKELVPMTNEELREFRKDKTYKANGYRGIKDEYLKFYGHLNKLDENGNVLARYYPETNDDRKITGYKCRNHPKDFSRGKVGTTGVDCQLSGQIKFNAGHYKYILLVGGEEDKVAAQQMLREHQIQKGQADYAPIPVVSPSCGESSAAKQCAAQYDWFDRADIIIVGMDNDEAGKKATKQVVEVLPKEKVRVATWSGKDPNKMLEDGKEKQFLSDFYNAKEVVKSGIQTSAGLLEQAKAELKKPRIPLPPFMKVLESMTPGGLGFKQGSIINIIGDTSLGKTTFSNSCTYFWMFNSPERPGVVSLEATAGQYTLDMISIHCNKNLSYGSEEEALEYLERPEVITLMDGLFVNEFGEPRWAILDERDGDIKKLEKQVERLITQYGCRLIIIDVLTDIVRGSPIEVQEDHMKWQKQITKSGVTIFNVLHTKKPMGNEKGRETTEWDALGSTTFIQSAHVNIVIMRDKMAEDDIERNTTHVKMPKCRGGKTGPAGKWYYDPKTRKVYDFDEFFKNNPQDSY